MYTMKHQTTTMTVRLPANARKRLEKLAKATSRTTSFLAADAIDAYLDLQEWQVEAIKAGIADADAGRVVPHEEVEVWVRSWSSGSK